jgi:hypothetical protein
MVIATTAARRGLRGGLQVVLVVELELPLVLVGEVEELLDRRQVASAAGLERHDVVVYAERGCRRAVLARDGGGGVVAWMIGMTVGEPGG